MRLLAACALVALLLQLLLVPSRYTEAALRERIDSALEGASALYGTSATLLSLQRAQAWQHALTNGIPFLDVRAALTHNGNGPAANSLHDIRERFVANSYLRSMRTLLELWCLRLAILLHAAVCPVLLGAAALVDGWTLRRLRRVLVRPDRPERFTCAALAALGSLWATIAMAGAPWEVPPQTLLISASFVSILLGQTMAWNHGGRA